MANICKKRTSKIVPASSATLFGMLLATSPALANNGWSHPGPSHLSTAMPHSGYQTAFSAMPSLSNLVHPHLANSISVPVASGNSLSLDLGSTLTNVQLQPGMLRNGASADIVVGGNRTLLHAGDMVSPAELVAVEQVSAGGQKIQIDAQGRAIGGTFSLNALTNGAVAVTSIVIPNNVTALDNVGAKSNVSISGDLLNYGSIVDISHGGHGASSSISALDIVNEAGGSITAGSSSTNLAHGVSKAQVNLDLNATKDFSNLGTITISGSLSVQAGGSLTNAGNITALHDITLSTSTIANSGSIVSRQGNLNLYSPANQSLIVNNSGGTLSAAVGAINVHDSAYSGTGDVSIAGGSLLSQSLNLNAGAGTINVNVENISGKVNSTGNAVHVQVQTGDLILGTQKLTGDPTFYNDSGNIDLTGDVVVSESLAIVASGDITADATVTQIAAQNAGQGFDINIIAGVNVMTSGGGGDSTTTVPGTQATSGISFTGASTSGGKVDFSGAASNLQINSSSTASNNNGGNVTIAAYGGQSGTSGQILLPTGSNINASGFGTGFNGNVTIAGSSTGGTAIQLGSITNGAAAGAAFVNISALGPSFSTGTSMTFDTTGTITSGNFIVVNSNLQTFFTPSGGSVQVGGDIISTGSTLIISNNSASVKNINANNLGILTGGSLSIGGNLISSGTMFLAASANVATTADGLTISTASTTGNGGTMTIVAGVDFGVANNVFQLDDPATNSSGGAIDFNTHPIAAITSQTSFTNAQGGNMTLTAWASQSGVSGTVTLPSAVTITTGGNGTGLTGNLAVFGSATSGTAISIGDVLETGAAVPYVGLQVLNNKDAFIPGIDIEARQSIYNSFFPNPAPNIEFTIFGTNINPGTSFEDVFSGTFTNGNIVTGNLVGAGQTVTVATGGSVHVPNIDASAATATSAGGYAQIVTGASAPLNLGGSATSNWVGAINVSGGTTSGNAGGFALQAFGVVGGVNSGSIVIVDPNAAKYGFTLGNGPTIALITVNLDMSAMSNTIDVSGKVNGNGGSVNLIATNFTWSNQASAPLTLIANGAGIGNGGFAGVTSQSTQEMFIGPQAGNFQAQANSGSTSGDGGSTDFSNSAGNIGLNVSSLTITSALNGNGGHIILQGTQVLGPANTTITVNGAGSGEGGQITLEEVRNSPAHVFQLVNSGHFNAMAGPSGGGPGGSFTATTSGTLSLNSSQLNIGPQGGSGIGASIDLEGAILALKGSFIEDAANAGGGGGFITLVSTGPGVLNITTPLSAAGGFSAIHGQIHITSFGGITNSVPITNFNNLFETVTGPTGSITSAQPIGSNNAQQITLSTAGKGSITFSKTLQATTINATNTTGSISLSNFLAQNVSATTSATAGTVTLTEGATAAVPLTVTSVTGKTVTIKSEMPITTSGPITGGAVTISSTSKTPENFVLGPITATGLVTITTLGNIINNSAITGDGGVKETVGGTGSKITVAGDVSGGIKGAVTLTSSLSDVDIDAGFDVSGKTVTLAAAKGTVDDLGMVGTLATSGLITMTGLNAITVSGVVDTSAGLKATATGVGALVAINGNVDGGVAATDTISSTNGSITTGAGSDLSAGKAVTLTAAKGGVTVNGTIGKGGSTAVATVSSLNKTDLEGAVSTTTTITATSTGKTVGTGNVVVAGNLTTTLATAKITLTSGALGTVDDSSAASKVSSETVTLTGSGGIHVAGTISSVKTLTLTSAKAGIATDATASLNGSADVKLTSLTGMTDQGSINAVTAIAVKSTSSTSTLSVGNMTITGGGISVVGAGTSVSTIAGSTQSATSSGRTKATVLIEDSNVKTGTIDIASTISTAGTSGTAMSRSPSARRPPRASIR